MARQVKGLDVRSTVTVLRNMRKTVPLPPLEPAATELMESRILASSWYPFEPFRELTATLHRMLFQETDQGAIEMGRLVARQALEGVHAPFVAHKNLQRVLDSLGTLWKSHYDFGEVVGRALGETADVWVLGYRDAPRWHALLIAGWTTEALRLAGAENVDFELRSGPWDNQDLDIEFGIHWTAG